jgi:BASS family bile acid:Na+ symporter
MCAIYLGTSNASNYLRTEMNQSFNIVIYIGLTSLLLCFLNFILGRFLGGREFSVEGGQSLGQKNNAFTIWIALTFVSPLAVLGPVFYVLFQNIFISWELYHSSKIKS